MKSSDFGNVNSKQKTIVRVNEHEVLHEIAHLGVGECLLFASEARLHVDDDGNVRKLGTGYVKFKTRMRLTGDCGRSRYAISTDEN